MNHQDLLRMALGSLRAHKMRSFLTLLGVIIGLMTIVVVVGSISGLNRYVADEIAIFAPDAYTISRFGLVTSFREYQDALKRPHITWSDYERLRSAKLQYTDEIAAGTATQVDVRHGNRRVKSIELCGGTGNFCRVFAFIPEQGACFGEAEDKAGSHVALIGEDTRVGLFPGVDPIGRTLLAGGIPFRVIGVMPKRGGAIDLGLSHDHRIYIPMSAYRQTFMQPGEDMELEIKARGAANLEASQDELRALLRAMRHTPFRAPDPFGILTQEALMTLWKQITGAAFLVMVLISSISLTVGGVVIMNIMLVSVAERTQEIGQRRAIGASQGDIRKQFLLEAAILSLSGGTLGILLGAALVGLIRLASGFPATVTPGIVGMGLCVSTLVGILAGYLPARSASKLLVIDALRAE